MPYGNLLADVVQSSTTGTPPQFNDGNSTQIGTLCRAWVNFNGQTSPNTTIRASFNVSSITYTTTGYWVVNLTSALADTNASCMATSAYTNLGTTNAGDVGNANMVTTSTIAWTNSVISSATGGTSRNPAVCQLAVYR
jgi:hypothetical protein